MMGSDMESGSRQHFKCRPIYVLPGLYGYTCGCFSYLAPPSLLPPLTWLAPLTVPYPSPAVSFLYACHSSVSELPLPNV